MSADRARLATALLGSALAVAGIALEHRGVVWAAIAVLAIAFLLRWWTPGSRG